MKTKVEIEIDIPEGWEFVDYRPVRNGDSCLIGGRVFYFDAPIEAISGGDTSKAFIVKRVG